MWKLPVVFGLMAAITWGQEETPDKRLRRSTDVMQDLMSKPDKGIPQDVFARARCLIIVPGLKKGAVGIGADYGRGFAVCRSGDSWSGPAAVRMGGGSLGLQLGVESTDAVILVMSQKGMDRLLGDKFTIGADASAAIGPVGRTRAADTDASLRAELLTYARSKGAFAGVALDGTTITADHPEDRKLYGRTVSNRAILKGEIAAPAAGSSLLAQLKSYGPQKAAPATVAQAEPTPPPPPAPAAAQAENTPPPPPPPPAVAQVQPPRPSTPAPAQSQLNPPSEPESSQSSLPQTASPYPLIGFCGLLSMALYVGFRFSRGTAKKQL